jgi:Na+-transporting methylmalonyl-CoA/oxaloacetate decarboxylase gamma subunit
MQNKIPEDNQTGQDAISEVTGNFKSLLLTVGGVAAVLAILVLLPMFLTYLTEGDTRAPAASHPTDSARKSAQNSYPSSKSE